MYSSGEIISTTTPHPVIHSIEYITKIGNMFSNRLRKDSNGLLRIDFKISLKDMTFLFTKKSHNTINIKQRKQKLVKL